MKQWINVTKTHACPTTTEIEHFVEGASAIGLMVVADPDHEELLCLCDEQGMVEMGPRLESGCLVLLTEDKALRQAVA